MISIFAKPAFLNTNPHNEFISKEKSYKGHGHLQRVSSIIRGNQIAERIGAKLNPQKGYENDVCIYVKPHVKKGDLFVFEGKRSYLDIIDGHNLGQLAVKNPHVGVIVCSEADYKTMSGIIPNKIVLIPQHHCNFENQKRTRTGIKTVGVIGTQSAFPYLPMGIEQELNKRGIKLIEFSSFFDRKDIIDFYLSIDVQIVWRPYRKLLSNPLKIVNAASFGIPTIAFDELAFSEVKGSYLPVCSLDEFMGHLDDLRNDLSLYKHYASEAVKIAEKYHIDTIAKLYENL